MELLWYVILSILLMTYVLIDGFDLGAGMAYLLIADTEDEKQKVLKSIHSIWDANEVWILAFVGVSWVVFPRYTSVLFDNFGGYILLFFLFLLFKTIFFNLTIVFKKKPLFKKIFGYVFGFINLMLVFFISLIFANILRGIFIGQEGVNLRFVSQYFSPFTSKIGLFDWFTVLTTVMFFVFFLMHGLSWIILKNTGAFNRKLKKILKRIAFIEFILIVLFITAWYSIHPSVYKNYWSYPFLFIFPILAIITLFGLMAVRTYQGENKASILSSNFIIFSWISIIIALFPNFIMSLDNETLTVFNARFNNPESYYVKWWILVIGVILLGYSIVVHKYLKGKN